MKIIQIEIDEDNSINFRNLTNETIIIDEAIIKIDGELVISFRIPNTLKVFENDKESE